MQVTAKQDLLPIAGILQCCMMNFGLCAACREFPPQYDANPLAKTTEGGDGLAGAHLFLVVGAKLEGFPGEEKRQPWQVLVWEPPWEPLLEPQLELAWEELLLELVLEEELWGAALVEELPLVGGPLVGGQGLVGWWLEVAE